MSIKLRDYQKKACREIERIFTKKLANNTLLCIPTGGGKTITAMVWLKWALKQKYFTKVIWVAHRSELIDQANHAASILDIDHTIWSASHKQKEADGQLVLTMNLSWRGLSKYFNGHNILLVQDEAHHAASDSYQRLSEACSPTFTLGLTATPVRLDGKDIGFTNIAYQKSFLDLVEEGYLAKPKYIRLRTDIEIDLKTSGGDFRNKDLQQLNCDRRNKLIIKELKTHIDHKKHIIFCVNRKHCEDLREQILESNHYKPHNVKAIDSTYPKQQRTECIEWFKSTATEPKILLNCALYIEGLDVPDINVVHLARPTASKTFYLQMIGRSCRITPNKKEFIIIDYVDQCDKYAYLAEQWTIEEFNEEPDPILEKQRQSVEIKQQRLKDLEEAEEEEEINIAKKYKRDVMKLHGIVTVTSDYHKNRKYIITIDEKDIMDRLFNIVLRKNLSGREFYPIVEESYNYIVGNSKKMSLRKFKGIAWAMWKRYCKKQSVHPNGGIIFNYRKLFD